MLQPRTQWSDTSAFDSTLNHLGQLFVKSFAAYLDDAAQHVGQDMAERILRGGPDARLMMAADQDQQQQKQAAVAPPPAGPMAVPATP
jgi:hypothetical protein